ncbi:MAG: UvrD-helicase domain-containing protein [Gammaproteobacteria bacterium]
MSKLNRPQQDAIACVDDPLLVLAGAGSGKTRVITHKIAHLLDLGYKPSQIYAVTFTHKAAQEMKSRLGNVLKKTTRGINVSTFHHLGLRFVREHAEHFGLNPRFSIFDQEDGQSLLRDIAGTASVSDDLGHLQHFISQWKNGLVPPVKALELAETGLETQAAMLYETYERHLRAYNGVDFDDLIKLPVELLRRDPDVRALWQNRIRYLLVDEYQDTNIAQYDLVKLLVGPTGRFTVVGDDDQSIYAWRGARPDNLKKLPEDFPRLQVIKLEQNYRSTQTILDAANQVIANNPHVFEKKLWSSMGRGDRIRVMPTRDEEDEARQVVMDIIRHRLQSNQPFEDYALLYRGNHQSRPFEKMMREYQIPYKISGGQSFFARSEVKDIMSYLKLMVNPLDDCAFLRIVNTPKRDVGPQTLEKLANYAQMRKKSLLHASLELGLSEHLPARSIEAVQRFSNWLILNADNATRGDTLGVIKDMIAAIDYETYLYDTQNTPKAAEQRMENVWELVNWIGRMLEADPTPTFDELVAKLSLYDLLERQEDNKVLDRVQLMTLHAAKGLEFPNVYLVGMEEELLPHRTALEEDSLEEERRLAYVGITRAKLRLTLTFCKERRRKGEAQSIEPSRFLNEIDAALLDWPGKDGQTRNVEGARSHIDQLRNLLSTSSGMPTTSADLPNT